AAFQLLEQDALVQGVLVDDQHAFGRFQDQVGVVQLDGLELAGNGPGRSRLGGSILPLAVIKGRNQVRGQGNRSRGGRRRGRDRGNGHWGGARGRVERGNYGGRGGIEPGSRLPGAALDLRPRQGGGYPKPGGQVLGAQAVADCPVDQAVQGVAVAEA